jgi:acyl carrier protein
MPADLTELGSRLREYLLKEMLRRPNYPLKDNEPLISGGMIDSFSLAQIAVFVEDTFGVYIPDTELTVANMDTFEQMTAKVREYAAAA